MFSSSRAISTIITINIGVFILWLYMMYTGANLDLMAENFLVSWAHLAQGKFWVLLTSAFSHNLFWHILFNMFVLNSFGPIVEYRLGTRRFVVFYLMAGIVSSLSHAFVSALLIGDPWLPALGASGAISGVILLFSLMYPREKILLLGLVPIPAMIGAGLFIGLDVWGLITQARGGGLPIGHGAHLGGAISGIIYYFIILKRRFRFH